MWWNVEVLCWCWLRLILRGKKNVPEVEENMGVFVIFFNSFPEIRGMNWSEDDDDDLCVSLCSRKRQITSSIYLNSCSYLLHIRLHFSLFFLPHCFSSQDVSKMLCGCSTMFLHGMCLCSRRNVNAVPDDSVYLFRNVVGTSF